MRLAQFIHENLEELLQEWEAFAASLLPEGQVMTKLALRDHARQMLLAVARDIEADQTDLEQTYKSKGFVPIAEAAHTAAMTHGALRYLSGFDLRQLAAEFRALRASVLRLWLRRGGGDATSFYQMTRFNESIDQALAESIANYSAELERSRDTFLAILGHDLRSPLAAVANSGAYLAGVLPSGVPLQAAQRVARGAARMDAMIKDLLEFARTRLGGAMPMAPAASDIGQICRAAYEEIRAAHPQASFRLEISGDLLGRVDGERLRQALSNLLGNAVQHGSRSEPVVLRARGEPDGVTLQVINHGPPIPEDRLQVIFNPLVRIPPQDAGEAGDASSSLGLGLYIAREIVTLHGGTLVAESSVQDGTVFSARLPRTGPQTALDVRP